MEINFSSSDFGRCLLLVIVVIFQIFLYIFCGNSWRHFYSYTQRHTSLFQADAVSKNNLEAAAFLRLKKWNHDFFW